MWLKMQSRTVDEIVNETIILVPRTRGGDHILEICENANSFNCLTFLQYIIHIING